MRLILKEPQEEKGLLLEELMHGDIAVCNSYPNEPFIITDRGTYVYLNSGQSSTIKNNASPVTLLPPGTTFIITDEV